MTSRFQLVPAAYVYLRRGNEILLQLRQGTGYMDGYWAAGAAGHVEKGESVFEAAVREVREELDLDVAARDLLPLTSLHRSGQGAVPSRPVPPVDERVDWFFAVENWTGHPRRAEGDKAAALEWFPLDQLPLMPPHERFVLEKWREGQLAVIETYGFELSEDSCQRTRRQTGRNDMVHTAFSIAGSEATGGAGAQADLKTFQELGTFGTVALTCLVSFDPKNNWAHRFVPIEPQVIKDQIEASLAVHSIDTVKIGMLGTVPTISAVAEMLAGREWKHVVVDPVLICKGQEPGAALDTDNALKSQILPHATVITPNVFEASQLSGLEVTDLESLKAAAKAIHDQLGVAYVVAKGGAVLPGENAVDVLYDGESFTEYSNPKIGQRYISGAGCTLAAAITAELAKGSDVPAAVAVAKETVTRAIESRISPPTPFDEVYLPR